MPPDTTPWVHIGPPWRPAPRGPDRLVRGGRYLVSGGTGGLGRLLVAHLRTRWQADVVALGRDDTAAGAFDGVFHLAGSLTEPWAAKRAMLVRLRATVDAPRWWLFSSISAVLPGLDTGIEAYAAANRWLEAYARANPGVTAIAWAPWSGVGMAREHAETLRARGITPIDPEVALAALEHAIAADVSNVLVMHRVAATSAGPDLPRLRALLERAIGRPVADDTPFTELGVDSLMAMDVVQELSVALGRELPGTLLFEANTLARLVAALAAPIGIPLLESQRTFVIQRRFFPDIPGNVFLGVTLEPAISESALRAALSAAIARHMVLRSVIVSDQLVEGGAPARLDWGPFDEDEVRGRPFDLERGPLLIVHCDGTRLVLDGHHAALDAWSLRNLLEELLAGEVAPSPSDWPAAAAALRVRPVDVAVWTRRFADGVPPLTLAPPATPSGPAGMLATEHACAPLEARAARLGVGLTALVLAAYVRRLWQWSGQHDVVVRVAHGRRDRLGLDGVGRVLGSFADSLPLRVRAWTPDAHDDLDALATRVQAALRDLPDAPSTALAALHRGDAPTGLTPAGFSAPMLPLAPGQFRLSEPRCAAANGFTGLGLITFIWGDRLHLSWNFLASHFTPDAVARFADGLFAERPPLPDRLHLRILARCRRHPERLAAPGLTYGQLDRRSAAMARKLSGARIGILARPSADALVAVLAVLRSGAAYVPLDPEWPDARIAEVLAAAGTTGLVTTEPDRFPGTVPDADEADTGPEATGTVAWVMYTSGSAGAPKGVEVGHAAALVFLDWVEHLLGVTETDRFVQTSSLGFGGSIRQMFSPLLAGATVVPAPPGLFRDPEVALAFLRDERITVFNSVPSIWARLLDAIVRTDSTLGAVRWVLLGGEAVPSAHIIRWRAHFGAGGPRLVNLYGSTETVVNATWFEITRDPDGPLCPIGRARAGLEVSLEGEEIVVRGAVAEGYLGGARFAGVFRTGDRGRRLADGSLVYLGRADSQVQVHGNRVEMGEVEAVLCRHPAVRFATLRFDGERLHAAVEAEGDPGDLRAWLAERLPGWMVPTTITSTGALPRSVAGKLVRPPSAPPEPSGASRAGVGTGAISGPSSAEPGTPTPHLAELAAVWQRILQLDTLPTRDDDFFALGGDSIAILDVLDALRDAGLAPPPATALYQARRLGDAAKLLGARAHPVIPAGGLTRAQKGFVLASRLDPEHPPAWTALVPIPAAVDLDRLRDAVDTLFMRHPILRTVFEPEPRVTDGRPLLQVDDLGGLADAEAALTTRWTEEATARYPLDRFPLVRLRLCRMSDTSHALLLGAHHAVADAWSAWVLADELGALYDGVPLLPVEPLPEEPVPDRAWWDAYLAGLRQVPGRSGGVERIVRVPPAPFQRVLRALFEVLAEATGADELVVATAVAGRTSRQSRAVGPLALALPIRAAVPFLDIEARFAEAAAHAPAAAAPERIAALGRYFLTWLDPDSVPRRPCGLPFAWADARYRFATASSGTEVMVGALVGAEGLTLHVTGGALADVVADALAARLGKADAALVIYAPAGTPLPLDCPTVVERIEHALGTSELVLLPLTADRLGDADLSAIPVVTGARVVALAGMLPATLGLGLRPLWESGPVLTTGHAATVVAVALTVEAALARVGRSWSASVVGALGYGSIGQAALALLVDRLGDPRAVRVRDPRVRLDPFDDVDLVIGATSGGIALEVATLRPGTIVVDDSFPPCLDPVAAHARMETAGDVLLVGGGMLDAGALRRSSPYPEAAALRARYGARWLPGCHAEAILVAADPGLGPTVGPVTLARARRIAEAVASAGWHAAPLHLAGQRVPEWLFR